MEESIPPYLQEQPEIYQIKIQGRISMRWESWFDEMDISVKEIGQAKVITTISGPVVDQAALLGLLQKLYNLGFLLLEVKRNEARGIGGNPDGD